MTTQHPARPAVFGRTGLSIILAATALAAALAAIRYEREGGGTETSNVSISGSSSLAPSRGVEHVMTEAEVIAQHEAQLEGTLGLPPFNSKPVSPGMSEADILAEHWAEIDGVFGGLPATIAVAESSASSPFAGDDGWIDARPIP